MRGASLCYYSRKIILLCLALIPVLDFNLLISCCPWDSQGFSYPRLPQILFVFESSLFVPAVVELSIIGFWGCSYFDFLPFTHTIVLPYFLNYGALRLFFLVCFRLLSIFNYLIECSRVWGALPQLEIYLQLWIKPLKTFN